MKYETYAKICNYFQETKRNAVVKYFNEQKDEFELKISSTNEFVLNLLNPALVLEVLDFEAVELVYRINGFGEFLMINGLQKISNKPFLFPKGSKYFPQKEKEEKK
jgi:hypothetical protein